MAHAGPAHGIAAREVRTAGLNVGYWIGILHLRVVGRRCEHRIGFTASGTSAVLVQNWAARHR